MNLEHLWALLPIGVATLWLFLFGDDGDGKLSPPWVIALVLLMLLAGFVLGGSLGPHIAWKP